MGCPASFHSNDAFPHALVLCVLALLAVPTASVSVPVHAASPGSAAVAEAATHGDHVSVDPQAVSDGTVVVETVSAAGPSFVVLRTGETDLSAVARTGRIGMDQKTAAHYYLALVASGLSVFGWLGVVAFGLYTIYLLVMGGPVYEPAAAILISFAVGAVFAMIEKALYQVD